MRLGAGEATLPACQSRDSKPLPSDHFRQGSRGIITSTLSVEHPKTTHTKTLDQATHGLREQATLVTCAGGVGTSFLAFFAFFGLRATLSPQLTAKLSRAAASQRVLLQGEPEKCCLGSPRPQWSMLCLQPGPHSRSVQSQNAPHRSNTESLAHTKSGTATASRAWQANYNY